MNMVNKAISEMNNLLIKRFGVISARYRGQEPCQIDRGGPSFLIVLFSLQLIFYRSYYLHVTPKISCKPPIRVV